MYALLNRRTVLRVLLFGFVGAALFFLPALSFAATFSFSPASGSFSEGEEFTVRVLVQPGGETVNAGDGTINFDSAVLSVSNISRNSSAFSLWTSEPSFSNSAGTVVFSGGTPTGFSSSGEVLSITFKGKSVGEGSVSFSGGSILAADGAGTDIYEGSNPGTFTIGQASSPPPAPAAPAPQEFFADEAAPLAPIITSVTHEDPDAWYGTSTAEFVWEDSSDATGVRTIISTEQDALPEERQEAGTVEQRFTELEDGVWYFFAQFRNSAGWGEIGRKKIQIDTTPPADFDILLSEEDTEVPKFLFSTEDELSGIDRYELVVGGSVRRVRSQEAEGGYPIPPQNGGEQVVVVKAFDRAGNIKTIEKTLTLPLVENPKESSDSEEAGSPIWTLERILLIVAALAIGALVSWHVYFRKTAREEQMRILGEVLAIRDKNDRIFSAMREEFEEMIEDFDVKPQLTPAERELLERIKEVLEISEGLVDAGIEELKKTVRGK